MKGFKDSTRMKYMCGGPVKKAVGGSVTPPTAIGKKSVGMPAPGDYSMPTKPAPTKGTAKVGNPMTKGTAKGTAKVGSPVTKGPVQPPQPPTKGKPDMYKPNIARNPTKPAPTTRPTPVAPTEPTTRPTPVAPVTPTIRTGGTPEEPGYSKGGSAKKGVPAHNSRPMIGRRAGGLAVMPKGKC